MSFISFKPVGKQVDGWVLVLGESVGWRVGGGGGSDGGGVGGDYF